MSNAKKVIAIFDIGKTNKKFFLFDESYKEVFREYAQFDEIKDDDGFPSEDLSALVNWMIMVFEQSLNSSEYEVIKLNFSSYGASLVHLDLDENILTPFYNYLKPIDSEIINSFFEKYGPQNTFEQTVGAPVEGLLNSGLQLYWLKIIQPEVYKKIRFSLHLPQYLSFIFSGQSFSDYTSIGCHTAIWDFAKQDYHQWVYNEGLNIKLAPIQTKHTSFEKEIFGRKVEIGMGIHDSSAALIPYLRGSSDPFILVSTGTWSVTMNPFSKGLLNEEDIAKGCITYLQVDGKPVRSAKLLLGKEYEYQFNKLIKHFGVESEVVNFNKELFLKIKESTKGYFKWKHLFNTNADDLGLLDFGDYETANHALMNELVKLQIENIHSAIGETKNIQNIYVDGGFSNNAIFMNILAHYLRECKVYSANSSYGSALGAAMILSDKKLNLDFLNQQYAVRLVTPFSLI